MFFPEPEMKKAYRGRRRPTDEAQRAIAVCAKCSIQLACLSGALERDEKFGIWGGMTTDQRDRLKQRRLSQDESA
jgi:WhiB family redox-sensing transcriptional regulator